ncbi:MAG TPA: hypothetical protein K8W20_00870, partial [Pseudomonas lactis]
QKQIKSRSKADQKQIKSRSKADQKQIKSRSKADQKQIKSDSLRIVVTVCCYNPQSCVDTHGHHRQASSHIRSVWALREALAHPLHYPPKAQPACGWALPLGV